LTPSYPASFCRVSRPRSRRSIGVGPAASFISAFDVNFGVDGVLALALAYAYA